MIDVKDNKKQFHKGSLQQQLLVCITYIICEKRFQHTVKTFCFFFITYLWLVLGFTLDQPSVENRRTIWSELIQAPSNNVLLTFIHSLAMHMRKEKGKRFVRNCGMIASK